MKTGHLYSGAIILLLALNSFAANAQPTKPDTAAFVTIPADAKIEMAASFPGGLNGWRKYLEGNLSTPAKQLKRIFKD